LNQRGLRFVVVDRTEQELMGVHAVGATFADRLNRLFDVVHPAGRSPYTSAEMVRAVRASGLPISAPYVSQLRQGTRTNPSRRTRSAIAQFFCVAPEYFTDEDYYATVDVTLSAAEVMHRDRHIRDLTLRLARLSAVDRNAISRMVDELLVAKDGRGKSVSVTR
jgi:transcriptional regulator with XRE-family HTH domain